MLSDGDIIVRVVIGALLLASGFILVGLGALELTGTRRSLQLKRDCGVLDVVLVIAGLLALLFGFLIIQSV